MPCLAGRRACSGLARCCADVARTEPWGPRNCRLQQALASDERSGMANQALRLGRIASAQLCAG
eukprot:6953870-Alexandrium_andersonii.AAC.1